MTRKEVASLGSTIQFQNNNALGSVQSTGQRASSMAHRRCQTTAAGKETPDSGLGIVPTHLTFYFASYLLAPSSWVPSVEIFSFRISVHQCAITGTGTHVHTHRHKMEEKKKRQPGGLCGATAYGSAQWESPRNWSWGCHCLVRVSVSLRLRENRAGIAPALLSMDHALEETEVDHSSFP